MSQILQHAVEDYLASLNRWPDPVADAIAREGRAERIPVVADETGRLLYVLAAAAGASRILEIGTATGHSTVWLAKGLAPGGLLLSIERDPARAATARANLARAGVAERVSVMIGPAERLVWKVAGPFDLIFQDGDKAKYEPLLDRLIDLLRPGGLLVTDNALWEGDVVDENLLQSGSDAAAVAAYNRRIASDPRLRTIIVPVGDGVALSVRKSQVLGLRS